MLYSVIAKQRQSRASCIPSTGSPVVTLRQMNMTTDFNWQVQFDLSVFWLPLEVKQLPFTLPRV